jgi:hypothetical protein
MARRKVRRRKTLPYYYNSNKQTAKQRGIPWEFTFDSWCKLWEESGKWEQRGKRCGEYCLCRKNDEGVYSPTNCYIGEVGVNASEALINWPEKKRARENGTAGFQSDRKQAAPQKEASLDANELGFAARAFIEIGQKYKAQTV